MAGTSLTCRGRWAAVASLCWLVALLAACAGPPPAPVKTGGTAVDGSARTPDGYYRVRRGDSLHAIAFTFGLDWREIARLNGISAPWTIYPDQLLRLTESVQAPGSGAAPSRQPADSSGVEISTIPAPASSTSTVPDAPRSTTVTVAESGLPATAADASSPDSAGETRVESAAAPPAKGTQAPRDSDYKLPAGDPSRWIWPTEGRVISTFRPDDPSRKGIDIGGSTGQPVIAAAAGQVVYSGSGLIGYGELVIIKHSDRVLSAYAHNSERLVSEGDQVIAGGQITKMGTNDRSQPVLHFEIRVNGSPQDPLKYLPRR